MKILLIIIFSFLNASKVKQVISEKDKTNQGMKLVENVINLCFEIQENDKTKKDKATLYNKKNNELFNKMSLNYNFRKVCDESLQYDFDPSINKYKKHHWNGKTKKEKDRFVNVFTDLLSTIVYPICGKFFGKKKIVHSVVNSNDKMIQIKSKIYLKKKYVLAEWFMSKVGKTWKVYDVHVEEESWVSSFRSQFTEVIEKKSYNELFDIMKKKKKEVLDKRAKKKTKKVKKTSKKSIEKSKNKTIKKRG